VPQVPVNLLDLVDKKGDGQSSGSNQINSSTTGISINNSGGTETRPYNFAVNWILKL